MKNIEHVPVVEVASNLEVAGVLIERIVIETHLTGDHDRHFDVKSDPLGPGDSQARHLAEDVVLLKLLQTVDLKVWFPQKLQGFSIFCAHVDRP